MQENDNSKPETQTTPPSNAASVAEDSGSLANSPRPRPLPSYGEITEGESGASLWQTVKMALRD